MSDFQRIAWDPIYSVQVKTIDAQHQELFSIVNQLIDLHESGSADMYPVFKRLVDYLSRHFHAEQMHMKQMKYPMIGLHIQEHTAFTEKIQEFLGRYQEGDRELSRKMLVFLSDWVFSHTTNVDIKYAAFSRRNPLNG